MESLNVTRDQIATMTKDHDLIKKLEALFTGVATLPTVDTTLATLAADVAALQASQPVYDIRITTGTIARTEEMLPLNVGQTALINWSCGITGGVARVITFAVPTTPVGSTYHVSLSVGSNITNVLAHTANNADELGSYGFCTAGDSAGVNTGSGNSTFFMGQVKRLT